MVEWNAGDYFKQSSLQEAMAAEVLSRLVLRGDEHVLDIGCGDGKITAQIADRVPQGSVLGVDPSQNMISFARDHFTGAKPNLRFEIADALSLGFDGEFDLIVSFNALHWVVDQGAALRSIAAALAPGGRAELRFVGKGARKSLEGVIDDERHSSPFDRYFQGFATPFVHFTCEQYQELAEANGLKVTRICLFEGAWDFKSRAAFVAFCRATFVAWTRQLPENLHDPFITQVLDRYIQMAADTPQEADTFKYYQLEVTLTLP